MDADRWERGLIWVEAFGFFILFASGLIAAIWGFARNLMPR